MRDNLSDLIILQSNKKPAKELLSKKYRSRIWYRENKEAERTRLQRFLGHQ